MKTRDAPPSSKGKDKAEESAPRGKTPMARFREAAASAISADPQKVRAAEEKTKKKT